MPRLKRNASKAAKSARMHDEMSKFKRGSLHSSSGQPVRSRAQAIAIGLSESGQSRKGKGRAQRKKARRSRSRGRRIRRGARRGGR